MCVGGGNPSHSPLYRTNGVSIFIDYCIYLVWYQNNIDEPEYKARYRTPADESMYALAEHYYRTRTNLLLAYMANWILLSK